MGYFNKNSFQSSTDLPGEADASSALASAIINSSSAAIIAKTLDSTVTSWNPAARALFGYEAAEMIGQPLRPLVPVERQLEEDRILTEIENGSVVLPYPTIRLDKYKNPVSVLIKASPIRDRNGSIIGASEIIHHTMCGACPTQRKMSPYRHLIENASIAILILDRDFRCLAANCLWVNYFGPQSAVVGAACHDVFPNPPWHWSEAHRKGLAGESIHAEVEHFVLPDGRKFWMRCEMLPWFESESDQIVGGIVIKIKDVTAEVQALRESELRLEMALNAAKAGTWECIPEEGILRRNEKLWVMLGQPLELHEPTINAWLSIINPDDHALIISKIQESMLACTPFEAEWRIKAPKGEPERWFFSRGAPVPDSKPGRYLGITVEMTEQKRMEEALRKSELRLHHALETARAGVWEAEPLPGTANWCDNVWSLLGLKPGQFKPSVEAWMAAVHPEDRECVRAQFESAVSEARTFEVEWRQNRSRDESERWCLTRGGPVSSKQPDRYVGVVMDITEKKFAEKELREAKDRKTFILSLSNALQGPHDPRMAIEVACEMLAKKLAVNRAVYAELNEESSLSVLEWNDGSMPEKSHIQDFKCFPNHVTDILSGRTVAVDDVRSDPRLSHPHIQLAHEHNGVAAFICVPIIKDGSLAGILGVHKSAPYAWKKAEITLAQSVADQIRRLVERACYDRTLRESDERLRFALSASNVGYFEITVKTGKILASDLTESFLNFAPGTLKNIVSIVKSIHPDDLPRVRETFRHCAKTGELSTIDWRVCLPDGKIRWLSAQGQLRTVAGRKVVGGLIQDITARVNGFDEQTQTLQTEKEQAEQKAKAHAEFLSNMSHELRTPMHAILSFAKFGLKKAPSCEIETLVHYFQTIYNSGTRLLSLLNDLLDLAKLESGRIELNKSDCDFLDAIEHVKIELKALVEERGLQLKTEILTANTLANFDKQRIIQVLINLLSNSIKFSPADGKICVTLQEDRSSAGVELLRCSVCDEGPGIAAGELESVFEKFIQSSRTKSGAGGTGLGLPICREIIKAHGGHIWAENRKPKGTTFHFIIPRKAETNAHA